MLKGLGCRAAEVLFYLGVEKFDWVGLDWVEGNIII